MTEVVTIKRKIAGNNTFKNVVDTNFNQLVPKETNVQVKEVATIQSFFDDYDQLFYDIPASGSNSHLDIINKSSDYLGISFQDLKDEIDNLRQENVSLKNQLFTITQTT